jgi:hypothetical protein
MPDKNFSDKISEFVFSVKVKAEDGLTVSELATITLDGMRLAITLLDRMQMPSVDKKAEVLRLVEYMFDTFADRVVPMYLKPIWFLMRSATRALVLSLAAGAVESLLPLIRIDLS